MQYDSEMKLKLFEAAGPRKTFELVLMKALADPSFKKRLLADCKEAVDGMGITPGPELHSLLNSIRPEQLDTILQGIQVSPSRLDTFAGNDLDAMKIAMAEIMIERGEVSNVGNALDDDVDLVAPFEDMPAATGSLPDRPDDGDPHVVMRGIRPDRPAQTHDGCHPHVTGSCPDRLGIKSLLKSIFKK